jgi:hypothetical protein
MLAVLRQHITIRALANEATDYVPASAIAAQERHYPTLIDIWIEIYSYKGVRGIIRGGKA